ncbi:MAG: PQQ-binding-like beta-propeller repeat protein, partial [Acidobacteria bacterium]|nr:PQQ-binding-like beta-propeller repeat protein [Acidobacteriota bacterium]
MTRRSRREALRSLLAPAALAFMPWQRAEGQGAVQMVATDGASARYWPRWRGPSGQGLVAGTGYVDTWSATQSVLWKTPVPGRGNSSPIVWGDRIFLTTARDGGQRLSLLAYRGTDGSPLWERFAPEGRADSAHQKNGYASATPATDGERIYVSFGSRGLLAFDLNGAIVWRRDIGRMDAYHGTAGSPLLYKDRLILYQDRYTDSFIAAFDARTGRPLWRTARNASVGWGSP